MAVAVAVVVAVAVAAAVRWCVAPRGCDSDHNPRPPVGRHTPRVRDHVARRVSAAVRRPRSGSGAERAPEPVVVVVVVVVVTLSRRGCRRSWGKARRMSRPGWGTTTRRRR